jgi:hypothetical protein
MSVIETRVIFNDVDIGRVWSGSNDGATNHISVVLMLCEDLDMSSRHEVLVCIFHTRRHFVTPSLLDALE